MDIILKTSGNAEHNQNELLVNLREIKDPNSLEPPQTHATQKIFFVFRGIWYMKQQWNFPLIKNLKSEF